MTDDELNDLPRAIIANPDDPAARERLHALVAEVRRLRTPAPADEVLGPNDDPGLDYLGHTQGFAMLVRVVSVLDAAASLCSAGDLARYHEARNLLAGPRFEALLEARYRQSRRATP